MQIHSILFETARFNCSEVKDHFINDCCFGEDMAGWLKERFNAKGIHASEPYQEDWGWELQVRDKFGSYYIGAGGNPLDEAVERNRAEWRVMVTKRRSLWQKLTGQNKLSKNEPIIVAVLSILQTEPDFSNICEEEPAFVG
jgi:hypothetical protein